MVKTNVSNSIDYAYLKLPDKQRGFKHLFSTEKLFYIILHHCCNDKLTTYPNLIKILQPSMRPAGGLNLTLNFI